jgi:ATP-dependent Clp protease ATP-binding subunit ClpA
MDAANLLKPPLARGQIRLIGATTEEEYTKYLEKDKALDRRFERVKVEEPDIDDSIRIVKGVVEKYQEHHNLKYTPEAVVGAVKYAKRYLSERNLPDIALDLVDEAGSEFSVKEEFARLAIPVIEEAAGELEKMLAACEGKETAEDSEQYIRLKEAYEEYVRQTDRLREAWGHRSELLMGAAQ